MMNRIRDLLAGHQVPGADLPPGHVNAAVVVPLFEHGGRVFTTFILRSESVGLHRGQMGFPGGMPEPADLGDPLKTALRETWEEIGVMPRDIEIAGTLSPQATLKTRLVVQPFVGIIPWPCGFTPDPTEVRSIHHACLKDLAAGVQGKDNPFGLIPPVYPVDGLPVWGLTARIVAELLEVLGGEGPTR